MRLIATAEEMKTVAMNSYVAGCHDICETIIEGTDKAHEAGKMPADYAQVIRGLVQMAKATLPPRPEKPL